MLKAVVLETGLLHKYSIHAFIKVISDFEFNGAVIIPFPLCDATYELLEALDNYAWSKSGFKKFLIVGSPNIGGKVDWGLVEQYRKRNYVMCIDDSGYESVESLRILKGMGLETLLVHGYDVGVKALFQEGLVDYSTPCYYPYFPDQTIQMDNDIRDMGKWTQEYNVKFLPSLQAFGKAAGNWRFPSPEELQALINVSMEANSAGVIFFEPFSGQSERGEFFEGFLDHPEVWNIINPLPPNHKGLIIASAIIVSTLALAYIIKSTIKRKTN